MTNTVPRGAAAGTETPKTTVPGTPLGEGEPEQPGTPNENKKTNPLGDGTPDIDKKKVPIDGDGDGDGENLRSAPSGSNAVGAMLVDEGSKVVEPPSMSADNELEEEDSHYDDDPHKVDMNTLGFTEEDVRQAIMSVDLDSKHVTAT